MTTLALYTPTLAQNLSHCNATDPNEIWCASMTVGEDNEEFGYARETFGSLSPDDYRYGVNGTFYPVYSFYYESWNSPPRFLFSSEDETGFFDGQSDLRLMLGTVELSFPTGTWDDDKGEYAWENPGLSWAENDVVPVKLFRIANRAPTASNGTVTTNEDTDHAFAASEFNFADPDANDALESVKIITLPSSGELQLNNAAICSVPQTVTKAQLDAGNLEYVPPANANGTDYASFTFKVNDGELDSTDDYTMTINVTAVADMPACAPPALTDRLRVWQQTLTVGRHEAGSLNELVGYGWYLDTGTLSGRCAPIVLGTNSYRPGDSVMLYAHSGVLTSLLTMPTGALAIRLGSSASPSAELTATEKAGLVLHVCGQAFNFANAKRVDGSTTVTLGPGKDHAYFWESAGLTWSNGLVVTLTLSMPTSTMQRVVVDPPVVDGAPSASGAGDDGSWSAGESVKVTLSFSEAVDVDVSDGTPSLEIQLGGTETRSAEYLSGSGTTKLVFSYTLGKNESSYTMVSVTPNSLALNGGTIRSVATQADALLAHYGAVELGRNSRNARNDVSEEGASDDTPITAEFTQVPTSHDGSNAFQVRISFSEEISMSYVTMRDSVLDVYGGSVTKARRLAPPSNTGWEITVDPSSNADVTISLSATTDCNATSAVCTSDGRALSNSLSQTVTGPELSTQEETPPAEAALTAEFTQVPSSHDGSNAFQVRISFSEEISMSYVTMRDSVLDVSGGSVTKARRLAPPSNIGWEITVDPSSNADVTISLSATTDCNATSAVCTSDGRALSNSLSQTVTGPGLNKLVAAPLRLGLDANFPNPFNTETQVVYTLPEAGRVELAIYNVLGQSVRTLVDQFQVAGSHRVQWDARDEQGASLSSGVYMIRLSYPGRMEKQRLLYLK